jgi:GntR family transcriptional repressor for pyruvate dehydrogenase complex
MKVRPIKKTGMREKVQEAILNAIKKGGLKPGDPLPGELELAARFQVSRGVVREAMSHLRLIGLVDSRKSRGAVLGQPDLFGALRLALDPAFLPPRTARELFELRLVVEMGMVELLFLRKNKIDFDKLDKFVEYWEVEKIVDERIQADINFHTVLYQATENKTLAAFQQLLRTFFHQILILEWNSDRKVGSICHRQFIDILKKGSCEELRSAMYEHLSIYFQRLTTNDVS